MKPKKLIPLLMVVSSLAAPVSGSAAQQKFKLERGTVQLDVPEAWQSAEGLFGVPLMVLGPEVGKSRPSLAVVPIGVSTQRFDPADLKNGAESYKAGREAWLKRFQGRSLAYLPYAETKLNDMVVAHSMGFRYEISGNRFLEKTYYVSCKEKLFHLKAIMTSSEESAHAKTIDRMIASFTCE